MTIPDDVRKSANAVLRSIDVWKYTEPDAESDIRDTDAIARAIMAEREAERERCAKVATGWREADYPEWFDRRSAGHLAEHIAAAIRKGE